MLEQLLDSETDMTTHQLLINTTEQLLDLRLWTTNSTGWRDTGHVLSLAFVSMDEVIMTKFRQISQP